MTDILLVTLNARYAHASMGLRYLRANLGDLRDRSALLEFVIGEKTEDLVEKILAQQPKIVGFGIYIWNVEESTRLIAQLKLVAPHVKVVIGGPEVSYELETQPVCASADYVITGWGDISFAALAKMLLAGEQPKARVIKGIQPPLDTLVMPYREYTDLDLKQRHIYVEASRGCPFKCEFCLSALDKTAWPFPTELFLAEIAWMFERGARQFKFVDRTFNLKIDTSLAILEFFLAKIEADPNDPPFLHFELVPDHLPDRLKSTIAKFPDGTLQFEIGIQTFNLEVQQRISRKQKNDVAADNLRWLRNESKAHLHVDLIAGLPGEDMQSFAEGFDRLFKLNPHEIQFGILKRLRGTPIARHTDEFDMRYSPHPPYTILANNVIDFVGMQRMVRFARYWDMVANSGRFVHSLPIMLAEVPFQRFMQFADWLFATSNKTHAIAIERLFDYVYQWMTSEALIESDIAKQVLSDDYLAVGARGKLSFVNIEQLAKDRGLNLRGTQLAQGATPERQARHQRGS